MCLILIELRICPLVWRQWRSHCSWSVLLGLCFNGGCLLQLFDLRYVLAFELFHIHSHFQSFLSPWFIQTIQNVFEKTKSMSTIWMITTKLCVVRLPIVSASFPLQSSLLHFLYFSLYSRTPTYPVHSPQSFLSFQHLLWSLKTLSEGKWSRTRTCTLPHTHSTQSKPDSTTLFLLYAAFHWRRTRNLSFHEVQEYKSTHYRLFWDIYKSTRFLHQRAHKAFLHSHQTVHGD